MPVGTGVHVLLLGAYPKGRFDRSRRHGLLRREWFLLKRCCEQGPIEEWLILGRAHEDLLLQGFVQREPASSPNGADSGSELANYLISATERGQAKYQLVKAPLTKCWG